ncbi:transglutaminase domain-containing protein [Dactylosporangium vinaceum]|uniref:Transglutaminase-like domain-containing protein n=1 Tax=Dactylosporangium vinaceum TaxID=53362 RepID=A0ABV5MK19_9ACTN|nr:transglutaminase-like domain-containing protein [Dactylosporangium vinaceum]UAB92757.1 transglutaminase domain-containing protein [Dactylosporangium vinaceum]
MRDARDAAALAGLGLVALLGFGATYAGRDYLVVAALGLAAGIGAAWALTAARQPVIMVAATVLALFFALGGPLVLTDRSPAALDTYRALALDAVRGWKELLTTRPPVTGRDLLVVPFVLALVAGAGGMILAKRAPRLPSAPVAVPPLLLSAVILLGTREPAARLADGVLLAAGCLVWAASRRRGTRPSAARIGAGALALTVAGLAAVAAAPAVAGGPRVVLRDEVLPPFDIGAYPSPLVGFRKFTKDAEQLYDQTLLTVSGLPAGTPLRIAVLDDYDGLVWGAAGRGDGGFERVGPAFGSGGSATIQVTIAAAYAAATDLNPWLPGAGRPAAVTFAGPRSADLAAGLRVSPATSAVLVSARLAAGDSYTMRTAIDTPALPDDAQPAARPALTDPAQALFSSKVAAWTRGVTTPAAQLRAVAAYLHDNGAYSDGGKGEGQFLPGHGTGRLAGFFTAARPVGDDEQYAAAYALVANYLGVPARVVLGARPRSDGTVRGADVHAWVEVGVSGRGWVAIPQTEFMPDVTKKPDTTPPTESENTDTAAVPPPNAARQPVPALDSGRTDLTQTHPPRPRSCLLCRVLAAMMPVLRWVGPPVLALAVAAGLIVGLKAARRRHRRRGGSVSDRYANGWRELVDTARDLGATVYAGGTRQEEAAALSGAGLAGLGPIADDADHAVYGPDDPAAPHAAEFWRQVDDARRRMRTGAGRGRRLRAALSLRSLRPRRPGPVRPGPRTDRRPAVPRPLDPGARTRPRTVQGAGL